MTVYMHHPSQAHQALESIVSQLNQITGVEYALVVLSPQPTSDKANQESVVASSIEPFDNKHFSIWASPLLRPHIGAVVEETLTPALKEHKMAKELPRFNIDLTDSVALNSYLSACLFLLQQETCKNIARTWIRHIEPRKQSRYPYKRGRQTQPPWWPKEGVQHREPDHLQKEERIALLVHLLLHSDFPLETLMEASNENKDVVPTHKRVFVEQAFEIAQVHRQLNRPPLPNSTLAILDHTTFGSFETINVYALTYGQNRYERKDDSRYVRNLRGVRMDRSLSSSLSSSPPLVGLHGPPAHERLTSTLPTVSTPRELPRPLEPSSHRLTPIRGWFSNVSMTGQTYTPSTYNYNSHNSPHSHNVHNAPPANNSSRYHHPVYPSLPAAQVYYQPGASDHGYAYQSVPSHSAQYAGYAPSAAPASGATPAASASAPASASAAAPPASYHGVNESQYLQSPPSSGNSSLESIPTPSSSVDSAVQANPSVDFIQMISGKLPANSLKRRADSDLSSRPIKRAVSG